MLALWLAAQFAYRYVSHATAGLFRRLSNLIGRMRASADARDTAVLDVLVSGANGRWSLGAVLHAAWLAYTLAALLVLAVLLGFTEYEVSWQTTLYDAERLEHIARAFNVVPSLLGLAAPEVSVLSGGAAASQAWGWWLLCAILAYGAVPADARPRRLHGAAVARAGAVRHGPVAAGLTRGSGSG
jgi:hypothetical protein